MDLLHVILSVFVLTILGMFIAFSPMLIAVNLLIVVRSKRPILNTLILMAGVVVPLIIVSVLAKSYIHPDTAISISAISRKVSIPPLIDLLFGLSLLAWAITRLRRERPGAQQKQKTALNPPVDKPVALFWFGFVKSGLSVTNIFAILVVVKLVMINSLSPVAALLALLWTICVGLVPFLSELYLHKFKRDYLAKLNATLDTIMAKNITLWITIALFVASAYFCISALLELLR